MRVLAVLMSFSISAVAYSQSAIGTTEEDLAGVTPAIAAEALVGPAPQEAEFSAASKPSDDLEDRLRQRSLEGDAETRARREGRDDTTLADVYAAEQAAKSQADIEQADVDIMDMDVSGSIGDAVNQEGYFSYGGDFRAAYNWADEKFRDGTSDRDDNFTGRLRFGSHFSPLENFRVTGRIALRCDTQSCDPDVDLRGDDDEGTIENGTVTIDELFVQWFRTERFNIALGRLQTRFVTRGGVFAKSLDRNNSNNTNITYTDGVHATIKPDYGSGWVLNYIAEYNDQDGATTTRIDPISFAKGSSKVSHFIAAENNTRWGYIVQRGIDVTFLPNALQVDGAENGEIDDYWGVVGRAAARFPLGEGLQRLQIAGELGYAPNTPTESAVDIELDGGDDNDTDGFAWAVSASIMDFYPKHSIGLLVGEADAGWLLSPQYRNNETLTELRYNWRPDSNLQVDARLRYRKEVDRITGSDQRGEQWQFYLRGTVRYSVDNIFGFLD